MEGDITACKTRWSQLLDELLDQILVRLSLPNIVSFGLVCKSWRSVMLARRSLCRPPPLLATLTKRRKRPIFWGGEYEVSLSCLIDDKLRKLSMYFPAAVLGEFDGFQNCWGNLYGWLHVSCKSCWVSPGYLLNPLSGDRIEFPATSEYDRIAPVALSSPPTSGCCTLIATMRNHCYSYAKLASWRRGDREWNVFANNEDVPFCMAFHRGELYVVDTKGVTVVYTLDGPNGPEFLGFVNDLVYENHTEGLYDVFLVGADELYLLVAMDAYKKFEVFKLDARRWVKITNLGDQALFVSRHHTHCYRTKEIMGSGLRSNCIYFLDYCHYLIYLMEDGSSEEFRYSGVNLFLMPNEW